MQVLPNSTSDDSTVCRAATLLHPLGPWNPWPPRTLPQDSAIRDPQCHQRLYHSPAPAPTARNPLAINGLQADSTFTDETQRGFFCGYLGAFAAKIFFRFGTTARRPEPRVTSPRCIPRLPTKNVLCGLCVSSVVSLASFCVRKGNSCLCPQVFLAP